jgi:3-vinyl bacteriochlorophyllide hydratase
MSSVQSTLLYTPAQRARRDASGWTLVQGILAPVQFLIFLVSLYLVVRSLQTGEHTTGPWLPWCSRPWCSTPS